MRPLFRKAHQQRHAQAGVLQAAFATRHAHAVIRIKKHDGVIGEAVRLQLIENLARLTVHQRDAVVVARPGAARLRGVGIKRRKRDACGIVALASREFGADLLFKLFVRPGAGARLVGGHEIKHREERLPLLSRPPVRLCGGFIPGPGDESGFVAKVVVGFDIVGAVPAGIPQQRGERWEHLWNRKGRAQALGAERGGMHAGDEAGA